MQTHLDIAVRITYDHPFDPEDHEDFRERLTEFLEGLYDEPGPELCVAQDISVAFTATREAY